MDLTSCAPTAYFHWQRDTISFGPSSNLIYESIRVLRLKLPYMRSILYLFTLFIAAWDAEVKSVGNVFFIV